MPRFLLSGGGGGRARGLRPGSPRTGAPRAPRRLALTCSPGADERAQIGVAPTRGIAVCAPGLCPASPSDSRGALAPPRRAGQSARPSPALQPISASGRGPRRRRSLSARPSRTTAPGGRGEAGRGQSPASAGGGGPAGGPARAGSEAGGGGRRRPIKPRGEPVSGGWGAGL